MKLITSIILFHTLLLSFLFSMTGAYNSGQNGCYPMHWVMRHVNITNLMNPNIPLTIHCRSKDDDLGELDHQNKKLSRDLAMADQQRPLSDHFTPTNTANSRIQISAVGATHCEIKPSIIQILPSFHGLNNEEPYKHLDEFLEICSTVKLHNFSDEALKLLLFPFSLKDRAKNWLHSLDAVITTWAYLQRLFLKKYFHMGRTTEIRRAITSFSQQDGEQFHDTWERFKELQRSCRHHAVPKWQLVQSFYDGLHERHRQMVDASCGGTFLHKNEDEAWQLFEMLSENSMHHVSSSRKQGHSGTIKKESLYEVGQFMEVNAKVASVDSKIDALTKRLDQLLLQGQTPPHEAYIVEGSSQGANFPQEQVQAVQGFNKVGHDPYSSTYNPGLRDHPNLSWRPPQQL